MVIVPGLLAVPDPLLPLVVGEDRTGDKEKDDDGEDEFHDAINGQAIYFLA